MAKVSPQLVVRASILAAVAAAVALFFTMGIRRVPPAPAASPPSQVAPSAR
jgi:hypothetical protein